MNNDVLTLTMESDAFNALKTDFNQVLRKTLSNMELKESEQAELTLKLKITLQKDTAPDFSETKYRAERDITRPMFTHKVSSVMQTKCEKSGVLSGNYELVWDEVTCNYIIRPVCDGQTSMFDNEPSEPLYLAAGETEPTAEAIDVEYETESDNTDGYDYEEPDDEQI